MKKIIICMLAFLLAIPTGLLCFAMEELPEATLEITVTATNGGRVYCDGDNWSALTGMEMERGTEITLEAMEHRGKFVYWKDELTGKIVSEEETYTFTLINDVNITAFFLPDSQLSSYGYVTFADVNGKILLSNYVADGGKAKEPDVSWIENPGYELVGWDSDAWEEVLAGDILIIKTEYEKKDVTYTLSVTGGAASPALEEYGYDDAVVLISDMALVPQGKVFAGWMINGELVSGDKSFGIRMGSDVVAEAVYAEEASESEVYTEIIDVDLDIYSIGVSILTIRNLPDNCEIAESGLLMSYGSGSDRITIDTASVVKGKSNTNSNLAMYRYNKNLGSGATLRAVPYVIYKCDGELYITYGTEKTITK